MEQWKTIQEFPKYEISSLGRVRRGENILHLCLSTRGYFVVCLCNQDGHKNKTVHRLLALAFLPNPENKPCIDHINRDKTDNRLENLRWVTVSENGRNQDFKQTNTNHHHIHQMTNKFFHVTYKINKIIYQKNFKHLEDAIAWRDANLPSRIA